MSDQNDEADVPEKTPAERLRDVVTRLKDMEHYSRANIEHLGADWFQLDDGMKEKELAAKMEPLMTLQNKFQETVLTVIADLESAAAAMAE